MKPATNSRALSGRTVLISSNEVQGELATELGRHGARVLAWPELEVGEPDTHEAIDEVIENLFGYDWLVFQNVHAADFFLRRFEALGHEISELDTLRVCGVGEDAVARLQAARVHLDVIPDGFSSHAIFAAIETYVGGRDEMRNLNLLIPGAAMAVGGLAQMLDEAGARADTVRTYRTVAPIGSALPQLSALLNGGGVDCIVFTRSSEVHDFARLFDLNDLSMLLTGVLVISAGPSALQTVADLGLQVDWASVEPDPLLFREEICRRFSK